MRSKFIAVFLIFSYILFYSPGLIAAATDAKGDLIGFVYGEDKTTPLEGAVIKARRMSSGEVIESTRSDKLGVVTMKGLDVGLYELVVSTNEGDFLVKPIVGIKENETAKVSFALKKALNEAEAQEVQEEKKKRRGLVGFLTSTVGVALITAGTAGFIIISNNPTANDPERSQFK